MCWKRHRPKTSSNHVVNVAESKFCNDDVGCNFYRSPPIYNPLENVAIYFRSICIILELKQLFFQGKSDVFKFF